MTSERLPEGKLDERHIVDAYARWAPVYDLVFSQVMRSGRKAVCAAVDGRRRILDVGVGTGLELPMIHGSARITGVDLSRPMLERARARVEAARLTTVDGFAVMDAMRLGFADSSFDAVIAPFVLSVVPNPAACLDEWLRVLAPGGELVLVNHFGADRGAMAQVEGWLVRRASKLGWHPQFPWAIVSEWLTRRADVQLVERRVLAPLRLFTVTRFRRQTGRAA